MSHPEADHPSTKKAGKPSNRDQGAIDGLAHKAHHSPANAPQANKYFRKPAYHYRDTPTNPAAYPSEKFGLPKQKGELDLVKSNSPRVEP
jgi:hypothetical protein